MIRRQNQETPARRRSTARHALDSTTPSNGNVNGTGNGNGNSSGGEGLTPGVVAAIAASTVAALAVTLASWLFIKYRRRGLELRRGVTDAGGDQGHAPFFMTGKAELPSDTEMTPRPPPEELPGHMAAQAHTLDLYPSGMDGEGIGR
ncbi:hypothetical protein MAPG_06440 [Magnaporthiopsis poae ATCC 64411]|uniref:Uncharacterized protein n=1 Tax=Magnaporthiopsis poae (strain ATCC 64411 / 73-15) TaxID=644358 RepID=A0A0C4E214_MAGP6|nr:hypothetical protein MAPG_06440 [Magnaporthiopsis poae ATCC 64411]